MSRFPGRFSAVGAKGFTTAKVGTGTNTLSEDDFWNPVSLGEDLVTWWDMMSETKVLQNGDYIYTIEDRSGFGNPLVQLDQAKQPYWVEHSISNSFEGAEYDGVNDQMSSTLSFPQPFTVVQIFKTGPDQVEYATCFGGRFASDALIYMANQDFDGHLCMSAGEVVDSGMILQPNTIYILVATFDDANSDISVNGSVIPMPNTGTFGVTDGPTV